MTHTELHSNALAERRATIRATTAQAIVRYLAAQSSVRDGRRQRLIPAMLGIFGHGNVAGLGQALDEYQSDLPFVQGRNEQSLVHIAAGYAKANRRTSALAVTASIGPGAANMVTGAALATVNRLPVLLFPGDTYATRRQGPVLQQLEHPTGGDVSVNDCFRPVARFFDRITRPEQLLTALPEAMRVLTSPTEAGAVVIALPQDIQSEAYDFPAAFLTSCSVLLDSTLTTCIPSVPNQARALISGSSITCFFSGEGTSGWFCLAAAPCRGPSTPAIINIRPASARPAILLLFIASLPFAEVQRARLDCR